MRTLLVVLACFAAVPTFAQEATPTPLGSQSLTPPPDAVRAASDPPAASQALTDAERCSVDSLAQRATIVALRAEVAKLQARVAELEAPLVAQAVATERQQLEQRFRDRLKPPAGSTFDWQTLTFTAPPPATAPPK